MQGIQDLAQKTPEPNGTDDTQRHWDSDPMLWPFAGIKLALDAYALWLGADKGSPDDRTGAELAWTTPHTISLELSTMRLRDFSSQASGQPVLICAPYALHEALIADFAPDHSIVEALQREGLDRVYVTDWRSARPNMRYLSINDYLADLNVAVDEIGPPVDLVGLCQGGWLALVFAARFPAKVRRLVLAGAPVDVSVPSAISQAVAALPAAAFESLVDGKTGVVSSSQMLDTWAGRLSFQAQDALQRDLTGEGEADRNLLMRFDAWNDATMDLPGAYYLEVVNSIFRDNRIATGHFVALGHPIHPADIRAPVFLLAGASDEIVPAAQALATARLLGRSPELIEQYIEPCGHLALFMGRETMTNSWRRIAHSLAATSDESKGHLRPVA
jgi:poly(3-hydroxyalkanoate) synthetase